MARSTLTATVRPATDHVTIGAVLAAAFAEPSLWPMWREARP